MRSSGDWFAATAYTSVADPAPDAPAVMATHGTLELAVHMHDASDAVTATVRVPPSAGAVWLSGAIVIVQTGDGSVELRRHDATVAAATTAREKKIRALRRMVSPGQQDRDHQR